MQYYGITNQISEFLHPITIVKSYCHETKVLLLSTYHVTWHLTRNHISTRFQQWRTEWNVKILQPDWPSTKLSPLYYFCWVEIAGCRSISEFG